MDDAGNVLPPFEPGLIYCRQAAYPDFTYINRPEDRKAIDRDGLVAVGDVGYFDRDGYLYICDRKSDMVISGGVNIYPAEIEAVLITMPEVADCAVFGIPDAEFGEALAAHVQPHNGAKIEREAVRASCASASPTTRCRAWSNSPTRCRARSRARSSSGACATRTGKRRGGGFEAHLRSEEYTLKRSGDDLRTAASGTHITALRFMKDYGFPAKLVATGNVPATFTSVMSGQVDIGFSTPPFGLDALAEGKSRLIALANDLPSVRNQTVRLIIANAIDLAKRREVYDRVHQGLSRRRSTGCIPIPRAIEA